MTRKAKDVLLQAANEVAVIATDKNGLVTVFNAGAEQMLGYQAAEIIGQPVPILDFPKLKDGFFSQAKQVNQALCQHKDGCVLTIRVTTSPIKNQEQAVTGFILMATAENDELSSIEELPNRRVFEIVLEREIRRMQRENAYLSLIRVQIDSYALYLAAYGEAKLNQMIRKVAQTLNQRIQRAGDLLAYHGQGEFMIVLPNTDCSGAVKLAEYIRLMVLALEIEHRTSPVTNIVTISCGIASIKPKQDTQLAAFMLIAQQGLKQAAFDGFNCSRIGEAV